MAISSISAGYGSWYDPATAGISTASLGGVVTNDFDFNQIVYINEYGDMFVRSYTQLVSRLGNIAIRYLVDGNIGEISTEYWEDQCTAIGTIGDILGGVAGKAKEKYEKK